MIRPIQIRIMASRRVLRESLCKTFVDQFAVIAKPQPKEQKRKGGQGEGDGWKLATHADQAAPAWACRREARAGKKKTIVITAIAREHVGFIWAIGSQLEPRPAIA
jgi:hypothetical protein